MIDQSTNVAAAKAGIRISNAVMDRMTGGDVLATVSRAHGAPDLPPGVVPGIGRRPRGYLALDSAPMQQLYGWLNRGGACLNGFPGYQYLAQLTQKSEYRAPAETMASEMTRKWIRFVSKGGGDKHAKIEEIEGAFTEFKVKALLGKSAQDDDFFGRAQLFVQIKGQENRASIPLIKDDVATIAKGSLLGFKSIEPFWTTPSTYNANDPTRDDFYRPTSWFVMGQQIHDTRLLTFVSREVPDMLKPSYNFGGLSMSQLMEPYVFQWYRTRDSVSNLIHNFSIIALKTNLQATLAGGDGSELVKRAQLFTQTRDNRGLMLLDKDAEELESITVPLSSLDKLQAQAQEHMAAPSHIPLVKLLGISPEGLNASSEGEIRVFYDFVRARQESFFTPNLTIILQLIQLHLFGAIDNTIGFEYVSLDEPTAKEAADIRKSDSETASNYIGVGVVAPDEVREKLQSAPDSGYDNLTGEAPEPPDLLAATHEHQLGEESAQNEHDRSREAAGEERRHGAKTATIEHQRAEKSVKGERVHEVRLARLTSASKSK